MRLARFLQVTTATLSVTLVVSCSDDGESTTAEETSPPSELALTLYTSVTQNTVDAVVAGFEEANPAAEVEVFRATTGDLNARIAADERSGGLPADVIWATDPLSMQAYAQQGLLAEWPLPDIGGVPDEYKTDHFWGTRLLTLVIVANSELTSQPDDWSDLTDPAYRDAVAVPDPAAAGSAFAALGYFSQAPEYGMNFYADLKANGAEQVATPPEVVTNVATGRYQLGMSLESEIRTAIDQGSPLTMIWPKGGAIVIYSPIGQTAEAASPEAAQAWISYVLSEDGQQRIADTGWQPVVEGVEGPPRPAGATEVSPTWEDLFGSQQDLLEQYQSVFGG